ncbi:MAG: right-handed parallel beta-helix repeat-containing protein [Thermoanaerobaculales bacterium]|jgi:hypothetical protein|nr:right-handed parallel beta-helix repeat-containing protein [Thermoanaerobaculales bacterium]
MEHKPGRALRGIAVAGILFLSLLPCTSAELTVSITGDTNDGHCNPPIFPCSLRDAIMWANTNSGPDTINVPAGRFQLTIGGVMEDGSLSGDLDILDSVTIVGRGPGITIIDGNGIDRVLHVVTDSTVTIRGVTITGGNLGDWDGGGAGIFAYDGTITIDGCDVVDNHITAGPVYGAGVDAWSGTVRFLDSRVRLNSSSYKVGAIAVSYGTHLELLRSTISGNHAADHGGVSFNNATGLIRDSTISGNTSDTGSGAIRAHSSTVTLEYSTISGNDEPALVSTDGALITLARTIVDGSCSGSVDLFATLGGNVESPGDTCDLDVLGDLLNVPDAGLEALSLNGGPTETHRPLPSSVVVDYLFPFGVPDCSRPDQRGVARPLDAGGGGTPLCDTGSVELIFGELFRDDFDSGGTDAWASIVS